MTGFADLDPELRRAIARDLPHDILPTAHPLWVDVLTRVGEDARGFAAMNGDRIDGWLTYTVTRRENITVCNSLPYVAYAGVHAANHETLRALLVRYREVALDAGADVVSAGTSPLESEADEQLWREAFAPTHTFENFVQLHDLTKHPLERLPKKRRDAFASEIRRARKAGLRVITSLDDARMEEWLAIYRSRYATIGANPYPDAFHRAVHELLVPAGAAEIHGVIDQEGRLRGGIVFLTSTREVTYFSSAFDEEARQLYATTFVLHEAFHAFMRHGVATFNWQSSPGRGGVFEYKKRWGAREHRHFYLSALLRPASELFVMRPEDVRRAFPLRFVLPFSAWSTIPPDAR